jgi:hypothetical protein
VRSGEIEVEIDDDIRASSLQPGDVLLIRTGAASHSFLRSHAKVWLEQRFGSADVTRSGQLQVAIAGEVQRCWIRCITGK